jgi:hypothetical protein
MTPQINGIAPAAALPERVPVARDEFAVVPTDMRQCAEAVELRLEDEVGRIERTDRSIEAREALRLRVELAKGHDVSPEVWRGPPAFPMREPSSLDVVYRIKTPCGRASGNCTPQCLVLRKADSRFL